jgi:uncharacterized protein (TIGR02118 family)
MIRVSVVYNNQDNAHFDSEYCLNHHMPLVEKLYTEFGLLGWDFDQGVSLSSKHPPAALAIANIYFDSIESVKAAFKNKGAEVMADTKNYTNIEPTITTSDVKQTKRLNA